MKRAITLLAGLTLASGIALAGDDMKDKKSFNELDTNADGVLSQTEVATDPSDVKIQEKFAQADTDQNGYLSPQEYQDLTAYADDESEDAE